VLFICYVQLEEAKGLPELEQFSNYLKFVFVDKFGVVNIAGRPNTIDYLLQILPYSFFLMLTSAFVAVSVEVILGALAAYKRGLIFDSFLLVFRYVTYDPKLVAVFYLIDVFRQCFPVGRWFTYEMKQIVYIVSMVMAIQTSLDLFGFELSCGAEVQNCHRC
jgi:ABC-type dipeptide/oligopeptide/nickel transport system permease component